MRNGEELVEVDAIEILEMLLRGDICDDPARIRRAIAEIKVFTTATFAQWDD